MANRLGRESVLSNFLQAALQLVWEFLPNVAVKERDMMLKESILPSSSLHSRIQQTCQIDGLDALLVDPSRMSRMSRVSRMSRMRDWIREP